MELTVTPCALSGRLTLPASKSQAHRALIAAALAPGESTVDRLTPSEDILATCGCLRALGAEIVFDGDCARVRGAALSPGLPLMPCRESGSTLRFLIPLALAIRGGGVFTGSGRLLARPMEPYRAIFSEKDIRYDQTQDAITVQGTLRPGCFSLPGNVSSQFITGLLFALPLLNGNSELHLTTGLESAGYVDMTLDVLRRFGVEVLPMKGGWHIPGNQEYRPCSFTVETDWSQAAFFLAANAMGSCVALQGLPENSTQGDAVIAELSRRLQNPGEAVIDVSQCPDLVPALAVQAALRTGERTVLTNAARLRLKESDRLAAVSQELSLLGAHIATGPDSMTIDGVSTFHGGAVESHSDHRIAMMLAIAATRADGPVTLSGAECVSKSYPDFWEDYIALGGCIKEVF